MIPIYLFQIKTFSMESKEIEPRNLTDKILESMSEAEANRHIEPRCRPTPEPKPINRPIPEHDRESIYEIPYSTHMCHNYDGSRISLRNFGNDQSKNEKWSLFCLVIGLVIGLIIGSTVTGLSMHFARSGKYCIT